VHVHRVALDDQHDGRVRLGEPRELLEQPPVLDRRGQIGRALALDDQPVGDDVVPGRQAHGEDLDPEPFQLGGDAGSPFAVIEEQHGGGVPG
jgi:hypothetical protein